MLSNTTDWPKRAHIVPMKRLTWFEAQVMENYVEGPNDRYGINAAANMMLLKSDLHKSFDNRQWTALPVDGHWVARFFKPTDSLGYVYHNREVNINAGVAPQLLFARFALLIFDSLISFIRAYRRDAIPIKVNRMQKNLTPTYATSLLPSERRSTPSSSSQAGQKRSRTNTPRQTNQPGDNDDDRPLFDDSFKSTTLVNDDSKDDDDKGSIGDETLYPAVDVSCDADGSIHGSKKRCSSFHGAIVAVNLETLRQKLLNVPLQYITRDEGLGVELSEGCL
jgi:hypothetical protein